MTLPIRIPPPELVPGKRRRYNVDVAAQLVAHGFKEPFDLDLGCGKLKTAGYVGLDVMLTPATDIHCNLAFGIPLKDACVKRAVANQVLEHFDASDKVFLIDEVHRVFVPGGEFSIMVPHPLSVFATSDPTHRGCVSERFFWYFTKGASHTMFNLGRKRFWEIKSLVIRKGPYLGFPSWPQEVRVVLVKV